GIAFPYYRVIVFATAIAVFAVLLALIERTRVGAMVRAGVDDMEMASGLGIPVSRLFTSIFSLGAMLAGSGGALGAPIFSVYPGLDTDMLPLALIVVILGGVGSLPGAFIGSIVVGAVSTFGQVMVPDLAYVILFLPMVIMLAMRPQGLLGRSS
ncbi:MAG: branched-chain amino acid ABC transporter permease, partial [Xanthobacteraceae bacterium]